MFGGEMGLENIGQPAVVAEMQMPMIAFQGNNGGGTSKDPDSDC